MNLGTHKTKFILILALLVCNALALVGVAWVAIRKQAVPPAAVASIQLGRQNKEEGIRWREVLKDGSTEPAEIAGSQCRVARRTKGPGYMYFAIDPFFKRPGLMDALVLVEYFDYAAGEFYLNYDAVDIDENKASRYLTAVEKEKCTASQQWRTACFIARNSQFKNSQNGGADFRIELRLPELFVRRVTVQRLDIPLR